MANQSRGGFASMAPEKQREIASKSGKTSQGTSRSSERGGNSGGARGGSSEQHRQAGRMSHKNK